MDYLSDSDIEVLEDVMNRYGSLTANELGELVRGDVALQSAALNAEIDYRLVFACEPASAAVERLTQEDQELTDALADASFEERLALLRA